MLHLIAPIKINQKYWIVGYRNIFSRKKALHKITIEG